MLSFHVSLWKYDWWKPMEGRESEFEPWLSILLHFQSSKTCSLFYPQLFMRFPVPFPWLAWSKTGIYSSDLWFSILKVISGADFYIRQRLKYFPQRFPTLTCKELCSLASSELSAFLKMPEGQCEILQISVWEGTAISHSPCLTSAGLLG